LNVECGNIDNVRNKQSDTIGSKGKGKKMTYAEAKALGYKESDRKLFRGYVSRKSDPMGREVKIARGKRKGQLYVELANFSSSQYSYRQYLTK
jgi:hypothetical protein